MNKEADIRGKVTPELKEQFTEILAEIGLTPSVAIGMFAKQVVHCQGLPFTPQIIHRPNSETLKAMNDVNNNHNLIEHENFNEMFAEWDKDLSNV